MKFTAKQYAEALLGAFSEVGEKDHDKVISNLVYTLQKNGDIAIYEKVIIEFEDLSRKVTGEKLVEVGTAHEDIKDRDIIEALNKMGLAKVKMNRVTDESLIGGIVIKTEDTLIDASVRNQLNNIKNYLA